MPVTSNHRPVPSQSQHLHLLLRACPRGPPPLRHLTPKTSPARPFRREIFLQSQAARPLPTRPQLSRMSWVPGLQSPHPSLARLPLLPHSAYNHPLDMKNNTRKRYPHLCRHGPEHPRSSLPCPMTALIACHRRRGSLHTVTHSHNTVSKGNSLLVGAASTNRGLRTCRLVGFTCTI